MNVVSRFEASLLTITRALTGQIPLDEALHLMRREHPRPRCLSRTAVTLLQDSLSKGVVYRLATWGWREARHLRDGAVVRGRLWQRVGADARQLHFSAATLEFLVWMTENDAMKPAVSPPRSTTALTLGDELVLLMAQVTLRQTTLAEPLRKRFLSKLAVLPLLDPEWTREVKPPPPAAWAPLLEPQRAWVLELLQPLLAERWLHLEEAKCKASDRIWRVQLGLRQHQWLQSYLTALETANRRDLARFLLAMGARLLLRPHTEEHWFANLDLHGMRLQERGEIFRAGLLVLREFERLERWQDEAAGIGYYDEEYAASQLWKSDWEALRGAEVCAAAAALVRRYTSLIQWEPAK